MYVRRGEARRCAVSENVTVRVFTSLNRTRHARLLVRARFNKPSSLQRTRAPPVVVNIRLIGARVRTSANLYAGDDAQKLISHMPPHWHRKTIMNLAWHADVNLSKSELVVVLNKRWLLLRHLKNIATI